jgi:hypothetical protein
MNDHAGWIGINRQMLHFLRVVGADRDKETGRFLVAGSIVSFLGLTGEDAEIVVGADAKYFIDGQPCGLAAGLHSTSYGMKVQVIGG